MYGTNLINLLDQMGHLVSAWVREREGVKVVSPVEDYPSVSILSTLLEKLFFKTSAGSHA
jgi:hypothetical protein